MTPQPQDAEIAEATRSIHAWFRSELVRKLAPVEQGPRGTKALTPNIGLVPVDIAPSRVARVDRMRRPKPRPRTKASGRAVLGRPHGLMKAVTLTPKAILGYFRAGMELQHMPGASELHASALSKRLHDALKDPAIRAEYEALKVCACGKPKKPGAAICCACAKEKARAEKRIREAQG
jgi:hypothetical protein